MSVFRYFKLISKYAKLSITLLILEILCYQSNIYPWSKKPTRLQLSEDNDTSIQKVEEFFNSNGADFESVEIVNKLISEAPKLRENQLIYQITNKINDKKDKHISSSKGD
ncbi:hypothetical protein ACTFIW_013310 [Dictyostelium discoideum]